MAHTELGLRERRAIEDMLNAKMSVDKIAAEIGRHRSTVFREIKRNRYIDNELPNLSGYYGVTAQRSAVDRRARRRKLVRFIELRDAVIKIEYISTTAQLADIMTKLLGPQKHEHFASQLVRDPILS